MRLLLVEDERSLSRALEALLKKNNYAVDCVFDGETALDYLYTKNYDGVILDVMMPKMDGLSVLRKLRADGDQTPVMILSAKSEIDDIVEGLDSGASDYLTKPFDVKELLARIRAMTRVSVTPSTVLTFGNTTLDIRGFRLSAPGGELLLPNKEFQIMQMMMRYPKQMIPTGRFMDRIWGFDCPPDCNVVWVYLTYLRRKLKMIGSDIEIKSHRGAGYCLEIRE